MSQQQDHNYRPDFSTKFVSDASVSLLARLLQMATNNITPSQWWDSQRPPALNTGEDRLWFAVLELALEDYCGYDQNRPSRYPGRKRGYWLFARRWLFDELGAEAMVTFEKLCEVFDLDVAQLREGIAALRSRGTGYKVNKRFVPRRRSDAGCAAQESRGEANGRTNLRRNQRILEPEV